MFPPCTYVLANLDSDLYGSWMSVYSLSLVIQRSKMAKLLPEWKNSCCNPFNKVKHNVKRRTMLRTVPKSVCEKFPSILPGDKICDNCRKQLAVMNETAQKHTEQPPELDQFQDLLSLDFSSLSLSDKSAPPSPARQLQSSIARDSRDKVKRDVGETPITKRKLRARKYQKQKVEAITQMLQVAGFDEKITDDGEIVAQLKEKFCTATKSEKIQILTILPKSWSIRRIQAEFGVSDFTARKVKALVRDEGILSTPNRRSLQQTTVDLVINFYESDLRLMPGKDCMSVRKAEGRITIQKRLILSNLRELYHSFKDSYPSVKVGFSKFAEMRPRHCVLAGASGTHSVCVCTIHQNIKLMFQSIKLGELASSSGLILETYQHCLAQVICNPAMPSCYLGKCKSCPGFAVLQQLLHKLLDDHMIDDIHLNSGFLSTDLLWLHLANQLMSLWSTCVISCSSCYLIPLLLHNKPYTLMNGNPSSSQESY